MVNQKRGKNVAIAGGALHMAAAGVMLAVWLWTRSYSAMAGLWLLLGGVGVWKIVAIFFYARQLSRREERELEELASRGAGASSVFDAEKEHELRPASAKLRWMHRWLEPAFTLLLAGYLAAMALSMFRYLSGRAPATIVNPVPGMLFLVVVGFLGFLIGRYVMGMSSQADWRPLRACGGYMLLGVYVALLVLGVLLAAYYGYGEFDRVLAYVLVGAQTVLVVELLLNFVLDLYRPRIPGQEQRASYDSRLLNLLADPGKIGHSISEAMNYQFGFEVSKTWFYQLLQKAFVPLVVAGAAILLLMSCMVVVHDGNVYVMKRLGRLDASQTQVLGPGLHFKLPWPIETVERFSIEKVNEVHLGTAGVRTPEEMKAALVNGHEQYLWIQEHGAMREVNFLVAAQPDATDESGKSQADHDNKQGIRLLRLVVNVSYIVIDPYKYGYQFSDPRMMIECVAYREMTNYAASATLDEPIRGGAGDRPEAIMTYGRTAAEQRLRDRIQKALEQLDVGVRVANVTLLSVHPPPEASKAFEEVVEAERRREQQRYEAEAEVNRILSEIAGTPQDALELDLAIRRYGTLRALLDTASPAARKEAIAQNLHNLNEEMKKIEDVRMSEVLLGSARGRELYTQGLVDQYKAYCAELEGLAGGAGVPDAKTVSQASRIVHVLFDQNRGRQASIVADARLARWTIELDERARAQANEKESQAFRAGGWLYVQDRQAEILLKYAPHLVKYAIGVDREKLEFRVNLEKTGGNFGGMSFEVPQTPAK